MISLYAHTALKQLDENAATTEIEPAIRAELVEAGFAQFTYDAFTITEKGRMFVRRHDPEPTRGPYENAPGEGDPPPTTPPPAPAEKNPDAEAPGQSTLHETSQGED